jgi:DNA-binding beta-propeller fold protein YncE
MAGTPSSRGRSFSLTLLAAVALLLCSAAAALGLGELTQKAGEAGCISEDGPTGNPPTCVEGRGIEEALDVAVSPDGKHVYVASFGTGLAIFERDQANGALRQIGGLGGCVVEGGDGGICQDAKAVQDAVSVAISPDGKSVYVIGRRNDAIAIFERDQTSGALRQLNGTAGCLSEDGRARPGGPIGECQTGRQLDLARSVAVSPDGKNVYVAAGGSHAITIFGRNAAGELEQFEGKAGCVTEDGSGGTCDDGVALAEPFAIAISPDGKSVYVSSLGLSEAVAVFDRDTEGGLHQKPGAAACLSATLAGCTPARAIGAPFGLTVSPDGKDVYVATIVEAVVILKRAADGSLSQAPGTAGCISQEGKGGCRPGVGMRAPFDIAVTSDGKSVYLVSNLAGSIAVFDRDVASGDLAQKEGRAACYTEEAQLCEKAVAINDAAAVALSPDGKNVYVAGHGSHAVSIFDRSLAPTVKPPPPPPPPPARDKRAPAVSAFKLAPPRFKATPKHGSSFRFTLSERADVTIRLERRQLRGKRVVFKPGATLSFKARASGANTLRFTGKAGKRPLTPGTYRATLIATDAAGNASVPRRAPFTVLR